MAETNSPPPLNCKEKIAKHLKDEERDWAWLSRKTDIPYATLYSIFVEDRLKLTQERLNLINIACKTEFEMDLVPAEQPNA